MTKGASVHVGPHLREAVPDHGGVSVDPAGGGIRIAAAHGPDSLRAGAVRPMRALRETVGMDLIGVVDTMFARYDMGEEALTSRRSAPGYRGSDFTTVRRPSRVQGPRRGGQEDDRAGRLPDRRGPGYAGQGAGGQGLRPRGVDRHHEAQLMTNTPILEVFVHEDESRRPGGVGDGVQEPLRGTTPATRT